MAAKHVLGDVCEVVKRSDIFHIDPASIEVVEGWNARTDFSGEEELVESIKARGVLRPLIVRKTKDKRLELIDGERRLRATLRARKEGAEIYSVPVIVAKRGTNDVDLFADSIIANDGKPFTPTEEASAYLRLIHWGLDVKAIAKKVGKSTTHVRNRLELANASPEVQAAVNAGEITIGQAQEIAKESDGNIEKQKTELTKAKARPKKPKLVLSFKKGHLKQTGYRERTCDPLKEVLQSPELIDAIKAAGFLPESIRISIKPDLSPKADDQLPLPLWEQTPDENGQYVCPECGVKVDKPDLCGDCYAEAKEEFKRNAIKDRARLSE